METDIPQQDASEDHQDIQLPLRDRVPDYAAVFAVGLAVCVAIGLVIWFVTEASLAGSIGYTVIIYGVILMMAGGASGGGYSNLGLGAVGAMFGTRRADEAEADVSLEQEANDPYERLRKGLRPEANPRAFWQVIGGIAYVVVGLAIVVPFS